MNEEINIILSVINEIEKQGYSTDQAIEIYKAMQISDIATVCYSYDGESIIDKLDSIEEAISNLTDENGIQYIKGEIAHCSY